MTTDAISLCLNCATDLHGMVFCGNCGQRNVHRRLVWRSLVEDLKIHVFEWDLPWLKTIRDLTIRPGRVCSDYADGRRVVYVNPIKYVFYILAILIILFGLNEPYEPYEIRFGLISQDFLNVLPGPLRFIFTNIPIYVLLLSPVAVLIYRVIFWKSVRNWVEICCFVFYMIGHCTLLYALMVIINNQLDPVLSRFMPYGDTSGILLMIFGIILCPLYIAYTSVYFFKSRLDWSFIGALVGFYSYVFVFIFTQLLLFRFFESIMHINAEFL